MIEPHGGRLGERLVSGENVVALEAEAIVYQTFGQQQTQQEAACS